MIDDGSRLNAREKAEAPARLGVEPGDDGLIAGAAHGLGGVGFFPRQCVDQLGRLWHIAHVDKGAAGAGDDHPG